MIQTVIIPVLNRYDLLKRCVQSIPDDVENILIIDNGDCLSLWDLAELEHIGTRLLRMPSNLGVPQSWNLGIKLYPRAPGWLLLNSDAVVVEWDQLCEDVAENRITLAGSPPWCCAWIGRDVVNRVGLFCEAYYPAYMEDVDYEERARRLGVPVVSSSATVHHDNSSTIGSSSELARRNDQTHQRNIQTHTSRWSGLAEHETPSTTEWSLRIRMDNTWD